MYDLTEYTEKAPWQPGHKERLFCIQLVVIHSKRFAYEYEGTIQRWTSPIGIVDCLIEIRLSVMTWLATRLHLTYHVDIIRAIFHRHHELNPDSRKSPHV